MNSNRIHQKVQKTFLVGDEWLYYKLYTGVKTADIVLLNVIRPLVTKLKQEKLIDTWFFIRYSDPEPHVRIRFHVRDINTIGKIIIQIKKELTHYVETHQIWNVQLTTYQRELARYATNTIEFAESFFYYDSERVLQTILASNSEEEQFVKVFNYLETLITTFNFTATEKLVFLNKMEQQFKGEFRVDKKVRKELSSKYRTLESMLFKKDSEKSENTEELTLLLQPFFKLNDKNELVVSKTSLLASFIHMTINRSFASKQRLYEMMLYDFLYRKYKSKNARNES